MNNLRLSLDGDSLDVSRGESELEKLKNEVKQKQAVLAEKSEIIASVRQQVQDLKDEIEELENREQIMNQKSDRLRKELEQKNEDVESLSHALKEMETANDNLSKRLEARTGQVQKFVEDLARTKKELEEARELNEKLEHKNEQLTVELELANSRKKISRERSQEDDEELERLKRELELSEKSWGLERYHKERYASENVMLDRELRNLKAQLASLEAKNSELELKLRNIQTAPPQPIPLKSYTRSDKRVDHQDENNPELTSAIHFPIADEIGEIMDSSSALARDKRSLNDSLAWEQQFSNQSKRTPLIKPTNSGYQYSNNATSMNDICPNHRIQKSSLMQQHYQQPFYQSDPIAEEKMRQERARELARRNMKTKPLHQTSYPLELDTFDTADLTEAEIKRGNVQPQRQALANFSNQRKPVKKAEAFIV